MAACEAEVLGAVSGAVTGADWAGVGGEGDVMNVEVSPPLSTDPPSIVKGDTLMGRFPQLSFSKISVVGLQAHTWIHEVQGM